MTTTSVDGQPPSSRPSIDYPSYAAMEERTHRPLHASSSYSTYNTDNEGEIKSRLHHAARATNASCPGTEKGLEIAHPAHAYHQSARMEAGELPHTPMTTLTNSTISTGTFKDDVADGVVRQAMGAYQHDRSEETLVGDFTVKWEPTDPPSEVSPLPEKRTFPLWRKTRHRFVNAYQRLFTLIILGNIIALILSMWQKRGAKPVGMRLEDVSTATATNVAVAILIRQEYIINLLYDVFTACPLWTPLRFRRIVAKLYHFGGIHSGAAVSALIWFTLNTVLITMQYVEGTFRSLPVIILTYILLLLLAAICLLAHPVLRFKKHNYFENFHRFGGWSAVALFWVQTVLVSVEASRADGSDPIALLLVKTPAFWLLVIVTVSIILPWLRLRKITVYKEGLSSSASRFHFGYASVGKVVGIRIATHPLKEWHPFATIPEADGCSFSVIISDAGDWTKEQIRSPLNQYWVRGVPISGILRMACIFKKVIVVATGSGIGPCLSLLIAHAVPCRILWSTKDPMKIYGPGTLSAVMKSDPEAMIIDTTKHGRPSDTQMMEYAHHLYKEAAAEAVFIVSNNRLTSKFVYAMESRGVPAYGPIWDS